MSKIKFQRFVKLALILLMVISTMILLMRILFEFIAQLESSVHRRPQVKLLQNQPLLNLSNFHLVSSPYACHPEEEVKALIVITSHAGNQRGRLAWRNGAPPHILTRLKIRRVFLLAIPRIDQKGYNNVSQKQVLEEATNHLDIVQGNFLEDYHNLTYKHAMGLQWAVHHCPQAQMLIKMDDDIVANLPKLMELAQPLLKNGTMLGSVFSGTKPLRNNTKWLVSLKDWPRTDYPKYLSGWFYITTPPIAKKLILALGMDFFWIDDVFITGVGSERAQVPLIDIGPYHYTYSIDEVKCCQQEVKCNLMVGPAVGDWTFLENYLQFTLTNRKGPWGCTIKQKQTTTTSQPTPKTSTQSHSVKNLTTK